MTGVARELLLATSVVALIFACTVQLRRGDQLPAPPAMMTVVVTPPPDVISGARSLHALIRTVDTTVQELGLETQRDAFIARLGQIVTAINGIEEATRGEVTEADIARLRELVDQTVQAIERRIEARLDDRDVQQLGRIVSELRRRMEVVDARFSHDVRQL